MKKIFLLSIFSIPIILWAQNWQNICSPGTTLFKDTADVMMAFRLDSLDVSGSGDTIYYSYVTIRDSLQIMECLDTAHGSVLGNRIILTHDGLYYFFNGDDDTIKVNSIAGLNQTWRFCDLSGGNYVQATVTDESTGQVLGQADQIRTITLQAKSAAGTNIYHPLNQVPFKLSRHYGLSSFYDVYLLPEQVLSYELAGKSSPPLGLQDFGYQEVYDFNVGDIFHYYGWGSQMGGSATWKKIQTILGKTVYGNNDSVDYLIERCSRMEGGPPPGIVTSHDTITVRYNFLTMDTGNYFMSLPNEKKRMDQIADRYTRRSNEFNGRQVKTIEPWTYAFDMFVPGCWSFGIWEFYMILERSPGLGETYSRHWEMWWETGEQLVYFKKGGEVWGAPVADNCDALVGIDETPDRVPIVVSVNPNPVRSGESLKISINIQVSHLQFYLYDLSGRQILKQSIENGQLELSTETLLPGLYLWHITDGVIFARGKIILE